MSFPKYHNDLVNYFSRLCMIDPVIQSSVELAELKGHLVWTHMLETSLGCEVRPLPDQKD